MKKNVFTTKYVEEAMQVFASSLDGSNVSLSITNTSSGVAYEQLATNGYVLKRIELPSADFSKKINREIAERVVVHETLHHMFTDFDAYYHIHNNQINNSDFIKMLANCIEDPYIESKGQERWKGVKNILDKGIRLSIQKGLVQCYTSDLPHDQVIARYILMWLFVHRCERPLEQVLEPYSEAVKLMFANSFDKFDQLVRKGLVVDNSHQVVALATDIAKFIVTLKQQDLDNNDQQSSDNGDGDSGDQQSSSNGGNNVGGQESFNTPKASEIRRSIKHSNGEGSNLTQDLFELLKSSTPKNPIELPSALVPSELYAEGINKNVQDYTKSVAQKLQSQFLRPLTSLLKSKNWVKRTYTNRGGEIESGRLFRTLTDGKCLKQEVISKAPNTAVMLLVDRSGSMNETIAVDDRDVSLLTVAESTMLALCKALKRLNIKNAAYGFGYCLTAENTQLIKYKDFNENPDIAGGNTGLRATGGTPTGPALMGAIAKIKTRNEPKKVIYVMTDGDPCSSDELAIADEIALGCGIEVYYVTIHYKWYLPFALDRVVEVDSVDELPQKLKNLSVKTI